MQNQAKKLLKIILVSIFFLLIVIFVLFNSRDLIFGVKIKNVNIADNMKATESTMKITGEAKNAVKLSLNGREISVDQQGNFDETIALSLGYNLIEIIAQDKFGNVDKKNYQIINNERSEYILFDPVK